MVKAILFDFDGVIVDTEPIHYKTFQETLTQFNIKIDEQRWYREFAGTGSPQIMRTLFKENEIKEDPDKWVDIRRERFWDYIKNNEIPLKKGLTEFLELLKEKGIKRAVASGSREDTVTYILEKNRIIDYFEIVLGRKSVEKIKPDPEIFLLGAKKLGLKPEECLVIEDSFSGITAAKRANIPFVCMESPGSHELKDCSAKIKDYKEFPLEILEE